MAHFTITLATEEEARAIALWRRIREWNYRQVGTYPDGQNVWLNAKDADGKLLGVFRGEVFFHWLFFNILLEGEAHAKKNCGATRSRLDTFDWQAPAFYLKHGYRELLKWPDYFRGQSCFLMVKEL